MRSLDTLVPLPASRWLRHLLEFSLLLLVVFFSVSLPIAYLENEANLFICVFIHAFVYG